MTLHTAACPTAHPDTMGENNAPTALKGCGVKKVKEIVKKNVKIMLSPILVPVALAQDSILG